MTTATAMTTSISATTISTSSPQRRAAGASDAGISAPPMHGTEARDARLARSAATDRKRPLLRFQTWEVAGDSMSPTLEAGDWVVSLDSRFLKPAPGRIAVLRRPGGEGEILIKRLLIEEPGGGWYVIGDQPARSTDSRRFGPVPEDHIQGIVLFRYHPLARLGRI